MRLLRPSLSWSPPPSWLRITTLDVHTGGEPLRIVTGGLPELPGSTMLERRRFLRDHWDHLRTALMWEPRGHRDMYGCIVTAPATAGADFGVLFMHNEGYSTMCGHGIIGIAAAAVETRMVEVVEPETVLRMDTPAGLVTARVEIGEGRPRSVRFLNVPSFVAGLDESVEVPGLGTVPYDLAFGGAFYAFVEGARVGLSCVPGEYAALVEKGMRIKRAILQHRPIVHPLEKDLGFLYGTIFIGSPQTPGVHSRNVCVFAEGEVDRSPTGTGVCGRMAIHFARGEVGIGQSILIESIIGSTFTGRVVESTTFGGYPAVIPEVRGTAHLIGRQEFFLDPDDPLRHGYLLR